MKKQTLFDRYYTLTKPGIVYGNAINAAAGFFMASRGSIDIATLCAMLAGLSGIIASSCIINNYIDQDIDATMERTRERGFVVHTVSTSAGLVLAAVLFLSGIALLFMFTTYASLAAALVGFVVYVGLYSLWSKRTTPYSTHIGAIAGAVPPVVGYSAVTGTVDLGAVLLFVIICLWQMPHFFAIAIRRREDYQAAGIPVWPLRFGVASTERRMVACVVLEALAVSLLTVFGYVGYIYLVVMLALCLLWIVLARTDMNKQDPTAWAKKMFLFSLLFILAFDVLISLDYL